MNQEPARRCLPTFLIHYRILLYILLGLAGVDAVIAANRNVWRSYDPDDYRERVQGCRRSACDLVFVGGSPMSEGIDPAVFSGFAWQGQTLQRAYNMGLPGATVAEVWHAVEHGLPVSPRLLVYGITASDLNDARLEPHGPRSLMNLHDLADWIRLRPRNREWSLRYFAEECLTRIWSLYYYRNGIRLWAADRIDKLWPGSFPGAVKEARDGLRYCTAMRCGQGFAPRPECQARSYEVLKTGGLQWTRFAFLEHYAAKEYLAYLNRLIDWSEQHGVALVLVDMPVAADVEQLYPAAFACYRQVLAEVEKTRGVRVVRAQRNRIGLTDAHFGDLVHLNAQGTARFSAWLRDELRAATTASEAHDNELRRVGYRQGGAE